jgi:hypothetical protein
MLGLGNFIQLKTSISIMILVKNMLNSEKKLNYIVLKIDMC